MLTLYDYFRSTACYRVRIALQLKKLAYDVIPIHLLNQGGEQFSESYQHVNPQQLVPSLIDHQTVITQSLAIIEYLEECHPTPSLFPKDPIVKAWARAFALAITSDIHPLNNLRVLTYLKNKLHIDDDQKMEWYQHWIHQGLFALEKLLIQHKVSGDFCFGAEPTIADICLVPQLFNARRFSCHLTSYPTLIRIEKNCQQLNAFTKAMPEETIA